MPSKRFYRIQEVSEMLSIPASTLRHWEREIPMFNPNRSVGGQRRFTESDMKMAARIKELLYIKGLSIDAAIEMLNKTYRTSFPRKLPVCSSIQGAITLLDEVKAITEDAHAEAKIEAVMKFLNTLGNVEK